LPFTLAKVPKKALTVGVGTVMDAREVLLIATGSSKAVALAQTIEGSVNHMCTSSALQVTTFPRFCANAARLMPSRCIPERVLFVTKMRRLTSACAP
jgi:6-phosphogluconolactonase/glucosamine-6-phosphate isomerase/deaminase